MISRIKSLTDFNFGPSLMDRDKAARANTYGDDSAEVEPDNDPDHGFTIGLKRKHKTMLLKKMLHDEGLGDLARMISIRED